MPKITSNRNIHFFFWSFIMFIGGVFTSYPQCPTVTDPVQSFCNIMAPTVSNLVAIDTGGGILWYGSPSSTTPLSNSTLLINGNTYYAGDVGGLCEARESVTVSILGPPFGLNFQGVCVDNPNEATLTDLFVIGNDVRWYNVPVGGSALPYSTVLTNTIYYADQADPITGCRTSRLTVSVNVVVVSVPTGDNVQQFCDDPNSPPTVADLVASGNNNWYASMASATILDPSTPLIDGESYFATTVISPCESIGRFEVLVNLTPLNNSGQNGTIEFCETDVATINTVNLFSALGGSPSNDGTWTGPFPVTNGNLGIVDITAMTVNGSPYVFTYTVNSSILCPTSTSTVSISIIEAPNAGSNASIDLCENDGQVNLFNLLGGTPDVGGIWSPALSSGTGVFDPSVDAAGIYTYTVSGTPPCGNASAKVTVTITSAPNAGLDASIDLCENDGKLDLFTVLGGAPDTGGTWSPPLSSGTGIFDPSVDAAGIYTYTVTGTTPCGNALAAVTVTITSAPNAGLNASIDLCENDGQIDLFTVLGGTPDIGGTWSPTLSSGTSIFDPSVDAAGIYTYTVTGTTPCGNASAKVTVTITSAPNAGLNASIDLCENDGQVNLFTLLGGTPDVGGIWSPALSSGTGVFDPSVDAAGIYTYTVSGTPPCGNASAKVTVTITSAPNAGLDASIALCENDGQIDLFMVLGGTPDTGGTWSPTLSSGTGVFDPMVDTAGVYTYTVSGTPPCGNASAAVTVNITSAPNAGLDASIDLCENDGPTDLFTVLGGTPDTGGTWSPTLSSGTSIFDPSVDAAGIYTYTVSGTPPCGNATAAVTVNITSAPNAGLDASIALCENDGQIDLFMVLGGTPDTGGTWSPALSSGTGVFDPMVDTAGIYTYTVSGTPPCGNATAAVTVTITSAPNAGLDASIALCENDGQVNLFTLLGGIPDTGGTWSPTLSSGTGIFDPSVDAAGIYTYTVTGTTPCGNATAAVTVTITSAPNVGLDASIDLCENDGQVNLFTLLGGTPDIGGTWSPALSSGTGIFDPSVDTAGVYTYTVSGTPPCGNASAKVTVTITSAPNAGLDASIDLCENDGQLDLFTVLGGAPDTGGTWSPTLSSGTGVFDPSVDAAGIYTYTVTGTSSCGNATAEVTVTITSAPNAGLDASIDLCENDGKLDLFTVLGGAPDIGGTWSPTLSSGTSIFDPMVDAAGIYTYTVSGAPPCGNATAAVTVTITSAPNAGLDASIDFCENDGPINLFTVLGGTPDIGGTWSPTLSSGTSIFDPMVDTAGVYTYTVSGTPPCGNATAKVTVTITSAPNAGLDASIALCENDGQVNLFTLLGGTPDLGGTWSPTLSSGTGVFDPSFDTAGIYTYTVTGTPPCGNASANVTVNIVPAPNAGWDASIDLCENDGQLDLFTVLGGAPDTGGTWSPTLSSGTGVFDPSVDAAGIYTYTVIGTPPCGENDSSKVTVSLISVPDVTGAFLTIEDPICLNSSIKVEIAGADFLTDGLYSLDYELSGANSFFGSVGVSFLNGKTEFTIPVFQVNTIGVTTLTIVDLFIIGNSCGTDVSSIAPVQFSIVTGKTPELINNGDEFCSDDNPTISDLSANVIDSSSITWYDGPINGNPYAGTTLLVDGETYYGSIISLDGCESGIRLEVTVSLNDCNPVVVIPDGFSPNGDGVNDTFNIKNLKELYPNFTLEIYNRYGNVLYKGNRNSSDWDGTSKTNLGGSKVPVGVYFYVLNFNKDGKDAVQGRVYLSR